MAQPPGWYPDVSLPGFERWWDGGTWSHVTRPVPGSTPPAPPVPTPQQPPALPQPPSSGASWSQPSATAGTPYASPSSGAPQYGPQYGSPQYGPQYGTTQYGTTQYGTTQYGTTQYGTTPYAGPGYAAGMPPGGYPGAPMTPDGALLGGRWARLGAAVLDGLLLSLVIAVVGNQQLRVLVDGYLGWIDAVTKAAEAGQTMPQPTFLNDPAVSQAVTIYSVISILVQILYAAVLVALRGATVGKMALGLKVRRVAAPGPVGWGPAVLRAVAAQAPRMVPFLGGLWGLLDVAWCLWDPQRQCLHDKIARTVVVKSR